MTYHPSDIRLLIADDHELVRDGIRARLEDKDWLVIVGEAKTGQEAVVKAMELQPDLIMMDVSMPNMNGLEATETIRAAGIQSGILILSIFDATEYVHGAISAGANGYILKDVSTEEMTRAIIAVSSGGMYLSSNLAPSLMALKPDADQDNIYSLTKRELDVLRSIATGNANKDIAAELGISVRTVESHRQSLRAKLGGGNAVHLSKIARELKLIE